MLESQIRYYCSVVEHILPYLLFLACPVSMGVMMWMMMRMNHQQAPPSQSDPRVADLESQVNELRIALRNRQGDEKAGAAVSTVSAGED